MPEDRRESNHKYYEKHKARWKKYRRRAKVKAKRKAVGPYMRLSDKQKTFKRAVDQGVDPAEAVKRAYPDTTNISRKLYELKQHPVLAISFDKFMADLEDVGLNTRYRAEKYKGMTDKSGKKSTPYTDKVASGILMHIDKMQGFEVQRSESRAITLNINVTQEQWEFMMRGQRQEEKQKEEASDGRN